MAATAGAAEAAAAVAAAAAHAPANPAADPEFLAWCASRGGVRTNGIAPAFVAEGWRGIVATAPLAPGDVLLAAPAALLMCSVSARRDPQLSAALLRVQQEQQQHDDAPSSSSSPPLSDHQVLTLHLLHEASKGTESFWAMYIRQLPPCYTTLACFSPAAVEALQAPHAVAAARAAVERARADWRGAWPVMQELGLPRKWTCLRAWLWASGAVLSRTMHLPGAPAGCLVPFGDLFNYRPPPPPFSPPLVVPGKMEGAQQHRNDNDIGGGGADGDAAAAAALAGDGAFDAAAGEYRLRARRAYAPGEQVFLCYGRHTNLELLEVYGFLLSPGSGPGDNPHDTAPLCLSLQPALQQAAGNNSGGGSGGLSLAARDCWLHADGAPSWQLLAALRRAAATPEERAAKGHLALEGRPIAAAGDAAPARWLRDAALAALAALPTTAEDDAAALLRVTGEIGAAGTDGSSDSHERECIKLAIEWRLAQKTILKRAAEAAGRALQDLG